MFILDEQQEYLLKFTEVVKTAIAHRLRHCTPGNHTKAMQIQHAQQMNLMQVACNMYDRIQVEIDDLKAMQRENAKHSV